MDSRKAWLRLFFLSFWVSLLLILFLAGFFYLSQPEKSGIREAALSIELPLSEEKDILFSLSVMGSRWEISRQKLKSIVREISSGIPVGQGKFYPGRLLFLIPAKYRIGFEIAGQSLRMFLPQVEKFINR